MRARRRAPLSLRGFLFFHIVAPSNRFPQERMQRTQGDSTVLLDRFAGEPDSACRAEASATLAGLSLDDSDDVVAICVGITQQAAVLCMLFSSVLIRTCT